MLQMGIRRYVVVVGVEELVMTIILVLISTVNTVPSTVRCKGWEICKRTLRRGEY